WQRGDTSGGSGLVLALLGIERLPSTAIEPDDEPDRERQGEHQDDVDPKGNLWGFVVELEVLGFFASEAQLGREEHYQDRNRARYKKSPQGIDQRIGQPRHEAHPRRIPGRVP